MSDATDENELLAVDGKCFVVDGAKKASVAEDTFICRFQYNPVSSKFTPLKTKEL